MKTKNIQLLIALSLTTVVVSCKKDKPEESTNNTAVPAEFANAVFVVNEGQFSGGTGTITYYNKLSGAVNQNIFETKNGYPLGNIAQSMSIYNGNGYVVVNNAGKVEIVNPDNFVSKGVISGFTLPRYFLGIDNSKAYISEWGTGGSAGAIRVVDLTTKTITQTIATGKGAEEMVKIGNKVYVACSGGFDADSVISIIDINTNTVVNTIAVGANPASMQVDANGKLWVLCYGRYNASFSMLEETGKLLRINPTTNTIEASFQFSSIYSQPSRLTINAAKNNLYYLYDDAIYSHSISAAALSITPLVARGFYSLAIDNTTDVIYAGDAGNFSSAGKVIRYTIAGLIKDSIAAGIVPTNFCFK
jgi:YVTN family beta-propeller protein